MIVEPPEGGPSKAELLELLKHCDVGTSASLTSSAISSRAPSPSPSLMSILYPGLKQQGGRSSIPASPLATPVLPPSNGGGVNGSVSSRSRTALSASASTHTLTNSFQPISSSLSESRREVCGELTEQPVAEEMPVDSAQLPSVKAAHKTKEKDVVKPKLTKSKQKNFHFNENTVSTPSRPELEGTLHLRSKSNEMEYVSSMGSAENLKSAFRSPPSSAQAFRPLSFHFQVPDTTSSVRDRSSVGNETGAAGSTGASGKDKDELVEDTTCLCSEDGGGDVDQHKTDKRSSWLEDFNESLWSNYFASPDQTS